MKETRLPNVNWTGVRPVYRKLDEEFHVLTDGFGLYVPDQVRSDMRHLIAAIDCVDRVLDSLSAPADRNELSKAMIRYLRKEQASLDHSAATAELTERLHNLRTVVWCYAIVEPFAAAIEQVLEATEAKRHVVELDIFLMLVEQEGEQTAQLPLLIMGGYASQEFCHFFTRFCALMGIADLLFDAGADHADGQLRIRPNIKVYWVIFSLSTHEGIGLLKGFPRKIAFVSYCLRFVGVLLKGS